ncbi:hypothetical protein MPER_03090 [Moniliophthora perniciosa FA553]|nr:hypothetical protein MPER_03090 [Moniliophthora perniciosa FA553]
MKKYSLVVVKKGVSYEGRKPLEQFCALGYTVANSSSSYYFAADLMQISRHRFYHIPTIGNGIVGHYADSYEECLQLAIDHPQNAIYNTHSLQYFAADVYARVIGNPGKGCTASGSLTPPSNTTDSTSTDDSTTKTKHNDETTHSNSISNGKHCHTHADGEVHCD